MSSEVSLASAFEHLCLLIANPGKLSYATFPQGFGGVTLNKFHHPLFRQEVLDSRADRLHGDVIIAVPVSWQVIGYSLLVTLAAVLVFLFTASYARVAVAPGVITLNKGVAPIVPSRPGVVAALTVRDGQRVQAGAPLARIRSDDDMAGGGTASRRILAALEEQDQRLASQTLLMRNAAAEDQSRSTALIAGLAREVASLDAQISAQRRMVQVAATEFEQIRSIAGRGFISSRDLNARETALLTRRQQLAQLDQQRAGKIADLAQARRAMAQARATAEAQATGVQFNRAGLVQQLVQAETAGGYTLTSPINGTVTAVTARVGQPASQQQPLMVIIPADATPRAELYVPTSAAGFLAVGQEVRLAVDAFPYQRYGTVTARIAEISTVAITHETPGGGAVPVYLVTAVLAEPWVPAFGGRQPLLPGMTLSARIVTQKQSLLEWLFEPVFAVRRR